MTGSVITRTKTPGQCPKFGVSKMILTLLSSLVLLEFVSLIFVNGSVSEVLRKRRYAVSKSENNLESTANEYRKQLDHQLSDLVARATIDKSFEKALLNALFQQQQQPHQYRPQKQQQVVPAALDSGRSELESLVRGDNSLSQTNNNNNIAGYKQSDLSNLATRLVAVSDVAYLSANDVTEESALNEFASSGVGGQAPTTKPSRLPCNFNAVSCSKNLFKKLVD